MRDIKTSSFTYSVLIKQDQHLKFDALEVFPGLEELTMRSRSFSAYADSVLSCRRLLDDLIASFNANEATPKFKLGAEVNPLISGQQTLSKDWEDDEVSRFWVYDRAMEGTNRNIVAISRASIFATPALNTNLNMI